MSGLSLSRVEALKEVGVLPLPVLCQMVPLPQFWWAGRMPNAELRMSNRAGTALRAYLRGCVVWVLWLGIGGDSGGRCGG